MACTLEKVLGDARTLLERLKDHDTAAEALIEQSGALSQRVHSMREVGNALPEKVRTNTLRSLRKAITGDTQSYNTNRGVFLFIHRHKNNYGPTWTDLRIHYSYLFIISKLPKSFQ